MTACRSMLWCNTQIPKCSHSVNSQTRENTFSKFQNFTIQVPKLYLRGVVVASSAAGNLLHWPWGVWGREEEKKTCGGVLWWSCRLCSSPFSSHSPTRSLKQDSDACGGGQGCTLKICLCSVCWGGGGDDVSWWLSRKFVTVGKQNVKLKQR